MKKFGLVVFWLVCSLYTFGTTMAEYDYHNVHDWQTLHRTSRDNVGISSVEALLGPFGAIGTAICTNFNQHGWELWEK